NAFQDVFLDQNDRTRFLKSFSDISVRLDWQVLAYCLMDNHYHLLVHTASPSLAQGMRDLNSAYAQHFNRHHDRVGHLFQGRYKAFLVERESYCLALVRYIARNPVRAGLCAGAAEWKWSSHRAILGLAEPLVGLAIDDVLRRFSADLGDARRAYAAFVDAGPDEGLRTPHPLVAGPPTFAAGALDLTKCRTTEVTRAERAKRSLAQYAN